MLEQVVKLEQEGTPEATTKLVKECMLRGIYKSSAKEDGRTLAAKLSKRICTAVEKASAERCKPSEAVDTGSECQSKVKVTNLRSSSSVKALCALESIQPLDDHMPI